VNVPAAKAPSARDRILWTAVRLFYREGIRAVGVDRVIAEAGVAKATLYTHFPAKDDLAAAYLEHVDLLWTASLTEAAEAAGPDPRARLVGMFDAAVAAAERDGFAGCGFLNAAAEMQPGDAAYEVALRHKAAVRDWVTGLAAAAGATAPDDLAVALTVLLDGALADGALQGSARPARVAKKAAAVLVAAALTTEGEQW